LKAPLSEFQEIPFIREIFVWANQISIPLTFQPKFLVFLDEWQTISMRSPVISIYVAVDYTTQRGSSEVY